MDDKYITQDGLKKLKEELEYLVTVRRSEISNDLSEALEMGDLKENAAYHDARERQAFAEGRILELEDLLKTAVVIDNSHVNKKTISIGATIVIEYEGNKKKFVIVGANESNPSEGKISNESPLGKAFIGKKVNDVVEVTVPKGVIKYKVLEIKY